MNKSTLKPMVEPRINWQYDTGGNPELEKALRFAVKFTQDIAAENPPYWLSLLGSSGVGKTHLAKKILQAWKDGLGYTEIQFCGVKSMRSSRFVSWRKFVARQRNGEYGEMIGLTEEPLLIVDDVGAERDPNGYALGLLDELADARLRKWTVWTSNFTLKQMAEQLDSRIASRMIRGGSAAVEIRTHDYNVATRK